ncbi:hypothetical protein ACC743_38945, partial [Rhizobium ruizarguesonis]
LQIAEPQRYRKAARRDLSDRIEIGEHLCQIKVTGKILLDGFSAKRSEKWKVFDVHDWTFEQIFLRLFARMGSISMVGGVNASPY